MNRSLSFPWMFGQYIIFKMMYTASSIIRTPWNQIYIFAFGYCEIPDNRGTSKTSSPLLYNALKGSFHEKKVYEFLLESDRPSEMMTICKKSRSKFPLFREWFKFWNFYFCPVWRCKKEGLVIFEIIQLGHIKFCISNILGTRNPKIVSVFEIVDVFIN